MQPEDIIVGKRYINKRHPGIVWLGCGSRRGLPIVGEYWDTEKRLVIVECEPEIRDYWIGVFAKQPNEDIDPQYWAAFELENMVE